MNTRVFLNVLSLTALAVAVVAPGTDPARANQETAKPPAVTVAEVRLTDITPAASFTGRVQAIDTVEIRARVKGFIRRRLFQEGDSVAKADLLFQIEKDDYQARVDLVRGNIKSLEGKKKLAEVERSRRTRLLWDNAASRESLDKAIGELTQTQGDLLRERATLKRAELDLSYTDITAPIRGRIGHSAFSEGDVVGPESGALATIVQQHPIHISFPLSSRELLRFREQAAEQDIEVDDLAIKAKLASGRFYAAIGRIDAIGVAADPSTDTVMIKAEFPNEGGILVHRQLVTVVVEKTPVSKLTVPQRALQIDQAGAYVLVVDADNKVRIQRVERGLPISGQAVIESGLEPGQRVITMGVHKVHPGMVVEPSVRAEKGG